MSLFKHALATVLCTVILNLIASAQLTGDTVLKGRQCATMEVQAQMLKENPALREQWKQDGEKKYQEYLLRAATPSPARSSGSSPYKVSGSEVVIPVVVHIVLPDPTIVTDRDVYEQIERLNIDYAGLNEDKTGIPDAFAKLFASTNLRFALARTDTSGNYTTGIERKVSSNTFTTSTYNNVKTTSNGLAAWNVNKYYNVWVARFSDGTLGISTFPYTTPSTYQGTVVNYISFGDNPTYVDKSYNLGRTLVHETGHYFYLYHIWGDDGTACTGSDFDTQSGYSLPASCSDDTPNQAGSSAGFLGGVITDACNTTSTGIMFQNYMDYSDDVSYGMFTLAQKCRMENALTMYRSQLQASQLDIPPSGITDAALTALTPGIRSTSLNIPVAGNGVAITARLRNLGSNILTSTQITLQIDGVTTNTLAWTGSLSTGADEEVILGNLTGASGQHTIKVFTGTPNAGTDNYTSNDTLTRVVTLNTTSVEVPYTENFESGTFPPAGWSISNPDNSTTWKLSSSGVAASGNYSVVMNNTNYSVAAYDDIVSPPIHFDASTDSTRLTFSVAYRPRGSAYYDGLQVWLSKDYGATYQLLYTRSQPDLASVKTSSTATFTPTSAQWRRDTIDLTPYLTGQEENMVIRFRNVCSYGANLYLDSISVSKTVVPDVDAAIQKIYSADFLCSEYAIHPSIQLANKGKEVLTSATINYQTDSSTAATIAWTGSLATGDTINVVLPEVSYSNTGQHTFTTWVSNPNNATDGKSSNDTLYKGISIFGIVNAPLTEGFESTAFPPDSWGIYNPDNKTTWQRIRKATTITASADSYAAVMTNYGYVYTNATDEMRTPVIKYGTVDSLFLLFDVAAAYNSSSGSPDTLQVLVTSDCGASYTSVYKKYGADLQTTASSSSWTPSKAADYRTDSINLTSILPSSGTFQVVFRNISNANNNVYIDNINIKTKVVLQALKDKGFLITPNPTSSTFVIQHYQVPEKLTGVGVYDMAGRLVTGRTYIAGTAPAYLPVNISGAAVGIYIVKLFYTDHTYSTKILKQ